MVYHSHLQTSSCCQDMAIKSLHFSAQIESYLDSTFSSDIEDINIKGFKMVRADNSNNMKRGGVCAYFRESLPVRVMPNHYLSECLILEINLKRKKGYLFPFIAPLIRI